MSEPKALCEKDENNQETKKENAKEKDFQNGRNL